MFRSCLWKGLFISPKSYSKEKKKSNHDFWFLSGSWDLRLSVPLKHLILYLRNHLNHAFQTQATAESYLQVL